MHFRGTSRQPRREIIEALTGSLEVEIKKRRRRNLAGQLDLFEKPRRK